VIAEPPLLAGAVNETAIPPTAFAVALTPVGASGTLANNPCCLEVSACVVFKNTEAAPIATVGEVAEMTPPKYLLTIS
jgi:hypothetical protein